MHCMSANISRQAKGNEMNKEDMEDGAIIIAAEEWFDARREYLSKEGKTIPEDLIPLANAEHNLMSVIRKSRWGKGK